MRSFTRLSFVIRLSVLLALVVSLLPPTHTARAASFTVNTTADNNTTGDGSCTLREAIETANNAGNGDCGANSPADDTITFSVSGTITLSSTLPNIVNASTAGTLTINGGGNITISGNNAVQVMIVNPGANLTLQNLTIINGSINGFGGGVLNFGGTLTVTDSTFSGNNAGTIGAGGGIYNTGTLTVTNSAFSSNTTINAGGGIYNDGTLNVTDSTFSANSAGGSGGGVYNAGALTITNSTFSANSAGGSGGGVYNTGSSALTVTNSTFSSNNADGSGGGIFIFSGTATLKNTLIANSTGGGDCVGSLSGTNNNNLIEDSSNACGLTDGVNGNIIGSDPNLGALTGSPAYFPLNSSSPAIDAGDNPTCADPPVNNQSQNGLTRPRDGNNDGNSVCDIGSYEHPSSPPVVASHSLQASYIGAGPASFTVTFNMPVADPPGNTNTDDVTNPANYLLIEKGPNAVADTASCLGGVSGDDLQQTVTSVAYNNTTFTATVTLTGALPVGNYRLFVCGTTSIVNADGVPLNNGNDFTFDFVVAQAASALPATGFAPGRVTQLAPQPAEKAYAASSLWLEIPKLGVKMEIVGVPLVNGEWDVSWLGRNAGWLEGSAFPTWSGNSVLTGHVWNADNTPGPFRYLNTLWWGDQILIHAYGQTYVYEVRRVQQVKPNDVAKMMKHETLPWLTLVTCREYDPKSGTYRYRVLVRAVLVEIK